MRLTSHTARHQLMGCLRVKSVAVVVVVFVCESGLREWFSPANLFGIDGGVNCAAPSPLRALCTQRECAHRQREVNRRSATAKSLSQGQEERARNALYNSIALCAMCAPLCVLSSPGRIMTCILCRSARSLGNSRRQTFYSMCDFVVVPKIPQVAQ